MQHGQTDSQQGNESSMPQKVTASQKKPGSPQTGIDRDEVMISTF
jgi:hypothetical protein